MCITQNIIGKRYILGILFIAGLISGCRSTGNMTAIESSQYIHQEIEPPKPMLLPADSTDKLYDGLYQASTVIEFYRHRNNLPVWMVDNRPSELCDSMISMIENGRYYGLLRQHYHFNEINLLLDTPYVAANLLRADALLTDAFFAFTKDLKYGRLNGKVESNADSLQLGLLQKVINEHSLKKSLELQEPGSSGYKSLKNSLKMLLDTLKEDRITLLQGEVIDSILLHKKVQYIEINLERWRWEKTPMGERYIYINIPSFLLQVVSRDIVMLESRVIVGLPEKPTPILSSAIECFVLYPYWYVPRKISVEEYLPIIQRDSSFITRNQFDVLDRKGKVLDHDSIEWNKFNKNYFPVVLRQREGPENSLGVIKFVFDNPYAVFLHDTNAKRLFSRNVRALSHGCIRMEKAEDLANYLATDDINKKSKIVTSSLQQQQRQVVNLRKPISIHIRYFTSEVRDNILYQYKDIYNQDQQLIDLFYRKSDLEFTE